MQPISPCRNSVNPFFFFCYESCGPGPGPTSDTVFASVVVLFLTDRIVLQLDTDSGVQPEKGAAWTRPIEMLGSWWTAALSPHVGEVLSGCERHCLCR